MEDQAGVSGGSPRTGIVCLRWYLCILAFLAPLRFGSVIVSGEVSQYPATLLEWLFGNWPPFLLGALAGIGLLGACMLCRSSLTAHPAARAVWVWATLPAVCLPGLALTTEWDAALTFILYLIGVVAFLAASMKVWLEDPSYRGYLLTAVVAATLLCALIGWHQRLWGFEEMRRFAEAQAAETGQPLSAAMQGKLAQTRVHRPFFLPNSYAAHLALTGPLVLLLLWRAGSRVEPVRVSRWLFLAVGAVLVCGAFWMSRSRGAQLALGAGLGVGVLSVKRLRRWRWPLLGAVLLLGIGLMFAVNNGRDLLSASARFQYYRTALRLFFYHPFTGVGLGEFFPHYLRFKPLGAEETRAAHNMVLSLLSQVGILGGLAAAACLALPLWLALFQRKEARVDDQALYLTTLIGLAAWSAHSLLDFNLEIPPTVFTAAVLPLYCFGSDACMPRHTDIRRRETVLMVAVGLLALAAAWRIPGERRYRDLIDRADSASLRELTALTERAAKALPLSPYPWLIHGRTALAMGRPYTASGSFARAAGHCPHRSSFHVQQAESTLLTGDWKGAAAPAETAWTWYPGSEDAMLANALVIMLQGMAADEPETIRWSTAALSCALEVDWPQEEDAPVSVILRPPPTGVPASISVNTLCERLSQTRVRTPLRSVPVRFVPGPDRVL